MKLNLVFALFPLALIRMSSFRPSSRTVFRRQSGKFCASFTNKRGDQRTINFFSTLGFGIELITRLIQIASVFSCLLPSGLLLLIFHPYFPDSVIRIYMNCVVRLLSVLGPTWIKLGQWTSTRPDLVPSKLISAFSVFHHHSPIHSFEDTWRILKGAFKRDLNELFECFDPLPCGSGSIAQVYRARLRDSTGTDVAVKVIHPFVHDFLNVDLALLEIIANIIGRLVPAIGWIGLGKEISHIGSTFKAQADLRIEGYNLEQFRAYFRGCEDKVGFPRPIHPLVSKDVLVESYEEGLPISSLFQNEYGDDSYSNVHVEDRPRNTHLNLVYDQAISTIFASFLKMVLLDNFSHADLHPGNLLIQFREHPNLRMNNNAKILSKFYKIRAYLWPISRFRAAMTINDSYNLAHLPGQDDFLFPSSKHFSPLVASPWLSTASPLANFASVPLPVESQAGLLQKLSIGTCINSDDSHESCKKVSARIVFLDAGLVTRLDPARFTNFLDLFKSLILWRDGYSAGKLIIERNPLNAGSVIDVEGFCKKMQFLVQNLFTSHPKPFSAGTYPNHVSTSTSSGSLMQVMNYSFPIGVYHIGPALLNLLHLIRSHHVRLDDQYSNLVMSMIFVEGLGRRLSPSLDLLPFVRQAAFYYFIR